MKMVGIWVALIGYTMFFVGYQNYKGQTISFIDALKGVAPSSSNASASSDNGISIPIPGPGGIPGWITNGATNVVRAA